MPKKNTKNEENKKTTMHKIQEEHITNIFCPKKYPFESSILRVSAAYIVVVIVIVVILMLHYGFFPLSVCTLRLTERSCSISFLCPRCIFCYNHNWVFVFVLKFKSGVSSHEIVEEIWGNTSMSNTSMKTFTIRFKRSHWRTRITFLGSKCTTVNECLCAYQMKIGG